MPRRPPPTWVAPLFAAFATVLAGWTIALALTLPVHSEARHYRLGWVGFDVGELALLARVAWLAHRRRPQAELPAVALATLLVADAWFDVTGAASTAQFWEAVALALLVELPTAVLCVLIAVRVESGAGPWRRLTGWTPARPSGPPPADAGSPAAAAGGGATAAAATPGTPPPPATRG